MAGKGGQTHRQPSMYNKRTDAQTGGWARGRTGVRAAEWMVGQTNLLEGRLSLCQASQMMMVVYTYIHTYRIHTYIHMYASTCVQASIES